jgi:NAD-dependent histone deacetylase SIR2
MKEFVEEERIPRCKTCKGLVKPDIVFFGESVSVIAKKLYEKSHLYCVQLPSNFFGSLGQLNDADLLMVIGTSLTVHPFASLVNMVKGQCPRVLINLDKVGGMGSGTNDLVFLGKCDDIIRDLAKELGWEEELDKEWAATAESVDTHEATPHTSTKAKDTTDEGTKLDHEIEKIADRVAGALTVSETDGPDVKADASTQDVRGKERTSAQPKTPQRKLEEGERSSEPEVKGVL